MCVCVVGGWGGGVDLHVSRLKKEVVMSSLPLKELYIFPFVIVVIIHPLTAVDNNFPDVITAAGAVST